MAFWGRRRPFRWEIEQMLLAHFETPAGVVEAALAVVQSFEPAGIAARDLRECLSLQLDSREIADPLVRRIVSDALDPPWLGTTKPIPSRHIAGPYDGLYNFDSIAYESVMVGVFTIYRCKSGPAKGNKFVEPFTLLIMLPFRSRILFA